MDPIVAEVRWRTSWFDEVDSTNRYLLEQASAGEEPGLVAVARYQCAGRGRLDRKWHAEPGDGLLFSVLLPAEFAGVATRAMALSVSDSCGFPTTLKWPNDVLAGDRKLAGILAETTSAAGELTALIVGCGLNVRRAPDGATCVDEWRDRPADTETLLEEILSALSGWLGRPAEVAETFRARCATLGQLVRVEMPDRVIEGRTTAVVDDGSLLVVDADGVEHRLSVGDVIHLRAQP